MLETAMFKVARRAVNSLSLSRLTMLLAPPRCLLCRGAGLVGARGWVDLCAHCAQALPAAREPWQFGPAAEPFTRVFSPWRYQQPLRFLVRALKFRGDRVPAVALGRLLAWQLADLRNELGAALPELLVPMPLHFERLRARGYNQADELARVIARTLQLPRPWRGLVRTRDTRAQTALNASERRRNVRHAFRATGSLAGRRVALIDDVLTTGSTARAAAEALHSAGAAGVELWVLARAERRQSPANPAAPYQA